MRMRMRVSRSSQESTGWSAKAPVAHGRGLAVGRTQFAARPETDAPQAPLPSRESAPFRLAPVFPPQRTVVEEIGEALGEDFSTVRIEPHSRDAVALGALAFARREEVGFAPGQYRPDTSLGRRLIAHELAHVAQQRRGPVPATGTIGDQTVNEGPRLESEAERLGSRAAAGAAGAPSPLPPPGPSATHGKTSSPAQMGKVNKAAQKEEQEMARKNAERERKRQEEEVSRLAAKPTENLRNHWLGILSSTKKTFVKIREIDQISKAHPRPVRLQGRESAIEQRLDKLDQLAKTRIGNLEKAGLQRGQALADDKWALAKIIVEGKALEIELGKVGSESEARLGPREVFAGDLTAHVYHTGSSVDPIPIVWYKNPMTDYAAIVIPNANAAGVIPGNYDYPNGPTVPDAKNPKVQLNLTVAAENQPVVNNLAAFELKKQPIGSRPETTPKQVAANAALSNAGYGLRQQNRKMDGDHVRDLGFGGADAYDNYWPLDERINRRAFHGYNSNYLVNYINHKDADKVNTNNPNGSPTTQPIGGMAGRYFVVKGYMANNDTANIPAESGKKIAGT